MQLLENEAKFLGLPNHVAVCMLGMCFGSYYVKGINAGTNIYIILFSFHCIQRIQKFGEQ